MEIMGNNWAASWHLGTSISFTGNRLSVEHRNENVDRDWLSGQHIMEDGLLNRDTL